MGSDSVIAYAELPYVDVGLEEALENIGLDPVATHYRLKTLPISAITCDFDFLDEDVMAAADSDPSHEIVVYAWDGKYGVLDGRHRLWRALALAYAELDAFVLLEQPCFD